MTALPAWSAGCALPAKTSCTPPLLEQRREAIGVAEDEIGALVGRGAPREADREGVGVEADAGARRHLGEQLLLERPARAQQARRRTPAPGGMRGSCQVPTCTPLVIAMMGAAPSTCAHMARAVSPWSWATALARRARRSPATVMLNGSPPISRISPSTSSQLAPSRRRSASGVHLVAGGHRRVGGEDDPLAHRLPRLLEGRARLHAVGDQLDAREDGVALVEVVEARRAGAAPAARARRRCRAASPGRRGSPGACRRGGG